MDHQEPAALLRDEIEAQRPYLLRFASLQLRNREAAEDAVQETLVAALAAQKSFAGRSQLRTWLTGILKHKIVDSIRRSSREQPLEGDASLEDLDALFDATGHWREPPQPWPEQALESKEFIRVLEECLAKLPARTAQMFLMREHLGIETKEICKELGVTSTHAWVLLYRARQALKECLQMNWFGAK
ncbi:MAG TPA: sigma-70 family RNA polymerase sigma factor [Burkholderiales bacterium]|nr:sigma-70 family RNA polymerase sigma factor [Burkholderiales bacterium]